MDKRRNHGLDRRGRRSRCADAVAAADAVAVSRPGGLGRRLCGARENDLAARDRWRRGVGRALGSRGGSGVADAGEERR